MSWFRERMTDDGLLRHRLFNQGLAGSSFSSPEQLVKTMGCIQSQDFTAAKWAIGSRIPSLSDLDVEQAFNEGKLLRTHVLRPTWHFVCPEDIGWMLKLTAPRIKNLCRGLNQQHDLDTRLRGRSQWVIVKALQDYKQLTRMELQVFLREANIKTNAIRLALLMLDAELAGLICSGRKRGNQFTYALMEDRVAQKLSFSGEAALAEISARYFKSRGPATIQDFSWWSGLSMADARKSVLLNRSQLSKKVLDGQTYWFVVREEEEQQPPIAHLLPSFDEYALAYKNRQLLCSPELAEHSGKGISKPLIVMHGKIAGTWKRTEKKDKLRMEFKPLVPFDKNRYQAVLEVAEGYARFVNKKGTYVF
jgi:hypothetical protein